MDLSIPSSTINSPLSTPSVFGDNVQDMLGRSALNVNPSAIITVNSIADTVDDNDGVTTLREAINQANADAGEDLIVFERSVFSNPQTITLSGTKLDITHNLDIIAPRDPLTGGDLVTVSGNKAERVFEIETGATVGIDGLIIADGLVTDDNGGGIKNSGTLTVDNSIVRNNNESLTFPNSSGGGAIYNTGTLTVNNSTIRNNSISNNNIYYGIPVSSYGGGILNGGSLTVNNSTISNNGSYSPDSKGGGIYNTGVLSLNNSTVSGNSVSGYSTSVRGGGISNTTTGIMTISNSTISDNSAIGVVPMYSGGYGGGIDNSGSLTVSNSTFSGNRSVYGGGINNSGSLTVSNSTFSKNTVFGDSGVNSKIGFGGGINNSGSLTVSNSTLSGNEAYNSGSGIGGGGTIRNTIIAGNRITTPYHASGIDVNWDVSGKFTSFGYNLIGNSTGSTGFGSIGDIVGNAYNPIDPRLAPLDFYGGPTQTIALLQDSPAIDAGDPTILDTDPTTDQRGFPRVINGRADIGAFEFSS